MKNYIISYDIKNSKIRKKVFDELKYLGFLNVQKSVFIGFDITKEVFLIAEKYLAKLSNNISYLIIEIEKKDIITNIFFDEEEQIIII